MKRLIAALALTTALTGCSTVMSSRYTPVTVTSEPAGATYTITDEDGAQVRTGTTPDHITLDAAAGFFDGQTYQVKYSTGETIELDSHTTGWYWVGFCATVVSGLMVDPATGDMWTLPGKVSNVR